MGSLPSNRTAPQDRGQILGRGIVTPACPDDPIMDQLERRFWSLGETPGLRSELLEGRIIIRPRGVVWDSRVLTWLIKEFHPVCEANGWGQLITAKYPFLLPLPPTREIVRPDHAIVRDADDLSEDETDLPANRVLMATEIVSTESIREDREVKPLSCAKAGVPFYLLVDRFTQPMSLTLMSEPSESGYVRAERVTAGVGGGKLDIPAPFGMTIDASKLPELLPWKGKAKQG